MVYAVVHSQWRGDQRSHTRAIGTHKAGSTIHCPVCLGMVNVPSDSTEPPTETAVWWKDEAPAEQDCVRCKVLVGNVARVSNSSAFAYPN